MANNNNNDYTGKIKQHDHTQIPNDQVSVNQDHEQTHDLLGDNGKSGINAGLEPLSLAIANEPSKREGITGRDLGYGDNQSVNTPPVSTNDQTTADNQINSQGVNTTAGGINNQSTGQGTNPVLSGGQGDGTQSITREQGGQGGDTTTTNPTSGQGGDINPQSVDREVSQVDQTSGNNQNGQGGDTTSQGNDNTNQTDNSNSSQGGDITTTADPQVQNAVNQQDQGNSQNTQASGDDNKPPEGTVERAAADLQEILNPDSTDTTTTDSSSNNSSQGGNNNNTSNNQSQGGDTTNTTSDNNSQAGDNTTTSTNNTGQAGDTANTTQTTTTDSGAASGASAASTGTNVQQEADALTAGLDTTAVTNDNDQQADNANAQTTTTATPQAPEPDGGASIGKEHGFLVGVSIGYEKKLKLKELSGDDAAAASAGLQFGPPEEFEGADAAAKRTAIAKFRDDNKTLADKVTAIGTGQIAEGDKAILKDYIRALPTDTQSFESYVSGYLRGFNEGYPIGRRKLAERQKEAENERKTTPDYEEGQKIGAEHGLKAAKGEVVTEKEKTNAKAGLDASGAKIKNKEGKDVEVGDGTTYIQGYYQAFNEYYMKGRQQIANERKAAEDALMQNPNYKDGYDIGFASGFWQGRPTGQIANKFQEVTDQANKNLTDLGLSPESLSKAADQIKALNSGDNARDEDKKKKLGFYKGFNKGYIQARMAINKVYEDALKAKMEDPAYMAGKQAGDLGGMLTALAGSKAAVLELTTNSGKWSAFKAANKIAVTLSSDVMQAISAGFNQQPESLAIISDASGDEKAKKIAYFKEAFVINFNQGWAKGRSKKAQNAQSEREAKLNANPNYTQGKNIGEIAAKASRLRLKLVQQKGQPAKIAELDKHLNTIKAELSKKGNTENDKAFKVGYYTAFNATIRADIIANIDADNQKKREEVQNMQNSDAFKIGDAVGAKLAELKIALNQKIATTNNPAKKQQLQKQLTELLSKVDHTKEKDHEGNPTIFAKAKAKGEEKKDPRYLNNFKQGYHQGYYRAGAAAAGIGGAVDYGQGNQDLAKSVEDVAASRSKDNSIDSQIRKAQEAGASRDVIDRLRKLKEIPQKEREGVFKEGANYGYNLWFENQKKSTEEGADPKQEDASEIDKKFTTQVTQIKEKYTKLKGTDEDGKETSAPKYDSNQVDALVDHYKRGHDTYGKPKGIIDGDSYRVGFTFGKKLGLGLAKEKASDEYYKDFAAAQNSKIAGEAKTLGLREARYKAVSTAIDAAEGRTVQVRDTLTGHARKGYDLAIKPWKKIFALSKNWPIGDDLKDVDIDLPEVERDPDDYIDLGGDTDNDSELKQVALAKKNKKDVIVAVQVTMYEKKRHKTVQEKELDKIIHSEHEKPEFNDFVLINGALEGAEASKLSIYVKDLIKADVDQFRAGYEKAIEEAEHGSGGEQIKTIFKAQGFRDGLIQGSEKSKETIEEELGFTMPEDTVEPDKEHAEYKKGYQEGLKAGLDVKLGIKRLSDFNVGLRSAKYQDGHKEGKSKGEEDAKNHGTSAESSVPNLESTNPDPEYKEGYRTAYAQTYWPLRAANFGYFKGVETVRNGGNAFTIPSTIPDAPAEMNIHYDKFQKAFVEGREAEMGGRVSDEDFKKMQDKEAFAAKFLNKSKNHRIGFDWGYKRIKDQIDKVKQSMAGENKPENIKNNNSQAEPPPPPKEKTSEERYIEQIKTFLEGDQVLGVLEDQAQYDVAEQTSKENSPKQEDKSVMLKHMEYTLAVYSGIKSGLSSLEIKGKSTDVSKIGYDNIKEQFQTSLATLANKVAEDKKKEDAFKELNITENFATKSSQWVAAVGEFGGGYKKGLEEANPEEIYRFAEELAAIYAQMNAQYNAAEDLDVVEHVKKVQKVEKEKEAAKNAQQDTSSQGGIPVYQKEVISFDKEKQRDPILDFPRGLKIDPADGEVKVGIHFRRLLQALATWNSTQMFNRFSAAYDSAYAKPYQDYYGYYANRFLYGGPTEIAGASGAATTSSGNSAELQAALDALNELINTHSSLTDFQLKNLPILPMFLEQRHFMEQRHRDISSKQDEIYFEQEEQFVLEELIRDSKEELNRIQKTIDDEVAKPVAQRDQPMLKEARQERKEYQKYIREDEAELKKITTQVEKHKKGLDEELQTAKGFFRDTAKFDMDDSEDDELFTFLDLLKSNAVLSGEFDYTDDHLEVKGRGTYILDKGIRNIEMQVPDITLKVGGIDLTAQGFTRDKDRDFISLFKGTVSVPRVEGDFNEKVIADGNYSFDENLVFTTSTGVHSQLKYHKESGKLNPGGA